MCKPEIFVFGDTYVDMVTHVSEIPMLGSASWGTQLVPSAGGSGANMAVTLSHLACNVKFISAVGNDEYGRMAINAQEGAGIDTHHVAVLNDKSTSTCIIMVDKNSERTILVSAKGTASDYLPLNVLPKFASEGTNILVSGLAIPAEVTGKTAEELLSLLPGNSNVFFDPNLRLAPSEITEEIKSLYSKIANRADVILAGQEEVDLLDLKRLPEQTLIIKKGKMGSLVVSDKGEVKIPIYEVPVVNATGAGDAYAAVFVCARMKGFDIISSARLASIGGALATTYPSAQGEFSWDDIIEIFETQR